LSRFQAAGQGISREDSAAQPGAERLQAAFRPCRNSQPSRADGVLLGSGPAPRFSCTWTVRVRWSSQETKVLPHHSPFPLRPRLPVAFLNMAYIVVPRCGQHTRLTRTCRDVVVTMCARVVTGRKAVGCRSAHPRCTGPVAVGLLPVSGRGDARLAFTLLTHHLFCPLRRVGL